MVAMISENSRPPARGVVGVELLGVIEFQRRMHEHEQPEFLDLVPERLERRSSIHLPSNSEVMVTPWKPSSRRQRASSCNAAAPPSGWACAAPMKRPG